MLIFEGLDIVGNTAPNMYGDVKPWLTREGVPRWTLSDSGEVLINDEDGVEYQIHQRTQEEIELHPKYTQWVSENPKLLLMEKAVSDFEGNVWRSITYDEVASIIDARDYSDVDTLKADLKRIVRVLLILRDYVRLS